MRKLQTHFRDPFPPDNHPEEQKPLRYWTDRKHGRKPITTRSISLVTCKNCFRKMTTQLEFCKTMRKESFL